MTVIRKLGHSMVHLGLVSLDWVIAKLKASGTDPDTSVYIVILYADDSLVCIASPLC